VTTALARGNAPNVVAAYAGHTPATMQAVYWDVLPSHGEEAASRGSFQVLLGRSISGVSRHRRSGRSLEDGWQKGELFCHSCQPPPSYIQVAEKVNADRDAVRLGWRSNEAPRASPGSGGAGHRGAVGSHSPPHGASFL
jgi:hypothetical protein